MREHVVLVAETGESIGVADKTTVHHHSTPLHLAFSAYVFNLRGELLVTRRAVGKRTWPGTWTNSCCGHPLPGESMADAVDRRLWDELRLDAIDVDLVLPTFRYRATMPSGIVENELCPVYRVRVAGEPTPEPSEVAEAYWVPWGTFLAAVMHGEMLVSPWCHDQLRELNELGPDPSYWPTASARLLPRAARTG